MILLGVKAWQVEEAAGNMKPMVGPATFVVPLQNGVEAASQLAAVLGAEHVLGGLCGTFSWVTAPGKIRSISTATFVKFGELDNRRSERVERMRQAFGKTSVKAEIPADIHKALLGKILARDSVRRGWRGKSGANRHHSHHAGNTSIATTMHGRGVGRSMCEPYTVERYRGQRQNELR